MEFKEYLAIIRRRWLLFFPIFLLIVAAHFIWVSYGQESRYAATSKVIIGSDRPLPLQGSVSLPMPLEMTDGTKEATITDYPVLRRAAEIALGMREFQSQPFQEERFRSRSGLVQQKLVAVYGTGTDAIEALVPDLEKAIRVERHKDRQIVEIHAEGADALEATLLSWAVAEAAHQFHKEKARESVNSFLTELDLKVSDATGQMTRAQTEMMGAQREMGIANIAEKERMILENVYKLEEQQSNLEAEARKNDRIIQSRLQEQSFGGRVDVVSEAKQATSPRLGEIRDRLFQAKLDLDAKVGTFSGKHPEVQRGRALIAGLEKAMAREQEVVLGDRYKQFSRGTSDLIKKNALFALEQEVLAERKSRLNEELFALGALRQDYEPKQAGFVQSQERLNYLLGLQKDVSLFAEGALGSVMVYDPAVNAKPVHMRGVGLGPMTLTLLMAFIFAIGVVYIVEYVDTRMKTEHDIRRHLNLPLLGIIPKEIQGSQLLTLAPLQSEISEKFNIAATLIQSTARELNLKTLMVCSAIAREGKTTVSVNLAVALARKGSRVLLVDADLRISQVHHLLRLPNNAGLSSLLETQLNPSQVIEGVVHENTFGASGVNPSTVIQATSVENLHVITAGPTAADPVHLLESGRLARLVQDLKQQYDFVIFDTPPINKVGDALTISSVVDGSVFVVGSGQAEQHDVMWAKHLLSNVQANVLGVFLNKFTKQRGGEYSYYYYSNDAKRKRSKSRV